MATTLSPIILFVYNRPEHVQKCITSLLANDLATESDLYIYSDAPKNEEAQEAVMQVHPYGRRIQKCNHRRARPQLGIGKQYYRWCNHSHTQIRTRHCTGR